MEHLTVLTGNLEVSSDTERVQISKGDTLRYAADVNHSIKSKDKARVLLIVKNV